MLGHEMKQRHNCYHFLPANNTNQQTLRLPTNDRNRAI